ncbi:thioredoxin family protein [Paenibacillus sp. J2TS4]|uniref:thioredoxin family protein n=1 Tax=Paenibacillus sp. J2TS4 TaxID=2807194 RepID=UPI001B0D6D50|nr:thioredoxin family protein [Paenibacillus sp. J2TS4]GIP32529.1 hypothetical protein J2TS4_17390 [Paenibacillus sp. J2TS4]
MSERIKKLLLFTLSACPMGRSMNTVLGEVLASKQDLAYEIVYVDVDHETTNHYRVKTNPTTLFLDWNGKELYRLEQFRETSEVMGLFEQIEEEGLRSDEPREENEATNESYTVYLYDRGQAVPVKTESINRTSVKAPRISTIKQLLRTRPEGLDNPFPADASLEQVSFHIDSGIVTLRSSSAPNDQENRQMEALLALTLAPYGIHEIKLEWVENSR